MKKKIVLSLLLVVSLFVFTGCGKVNNEEANSNKEKNQVIEDNKDKLVINGYDLSLNENNTFSKIKFKYPHDAIISNPITSFIIDYKKTDSDESVVRVVMGDMYGTNIDNSMEGFTKEGTKTINGIEWSIYTKDGKRSYGFNINYSNIVIGFIYNDPDMSKFEEEFMKNVTLNEEENK